MWPSCLGNTRAVLFLHHIYIGITPPVAKDLFPIYTDVTKVLIGSIDALEMGNKLFSVSKLYSIQ